MTHVLRLFGLGLLASMLGCQMVAGIEREHSPLETETHDDLCSDYCQVVDEHCKGDYQVYHDPMQCAQACKNLPPSSVKGSENSVECRLQVAASISSEQTDCAGAGPGGGGPGGANVCGTNCEGYCQLMSRACAKPEYQGYWLGSIDKCVAACQGLRDRGKDEGNPGTTSLYSAGDDKARDHFGDTLQCRLFHAVAASAPQGDSTHCWHAALSPHANATLGSTNLCLAEPQQTEPRCSDYCRLIMVACTGDLQVYDSEPQCRAGCSKAFLPGSIKDDRPPEAATHKNTLGCRYTHAYNALVAANATQKQQHCGHASPSGDGICGSACESYCYQMSVTCPSEAKDQAQCEAQCKELAAPMGTPYSLKLAASGNSQLACRLHALTEARENAGKADVLKAKCEVASGKRPCP